VFDSIYKQHLRSPLSFPDAVQSSTDNSLPPPPDQIPEAQEDVEANIDDSNKYEETVSDVAFPGTPAVVADEKKDTGTAVVEGGSFCKTSTILEGFGISQHFDQNKKQTSAKFCVMATGRKLNLHSARKMALRIFLSTKFSLQRN